MSFNSDMFFGATPEIFKRAENLRKRMTEPEQILWEKLKNYRKTGFKFRRQHPIGPFIADFYCHAAKVVIELDGKHHLQEEVKANDLERTAIINSWGIEVIRFENKLILSDIENVLSIIENRLNTGAQGPL